MKRLIPITCSFLVLFAGVVAAWASCEQISFGPGEKERSQPAAHAHDHHTGSDHNHSHDSVIHCPSLDEFVPVAAFLPLPDDRLDRLPAALVAGLHPQLSPHGCRSMHGPPGFTQSNNNSAYLLLSVLRI